MFPGSGSACGTHPSFPIGDSTEWDKWLKQYSMKALASLASPFEKFTLLSNSYLIKHSVKTSATRRYKRAKLLPQMKPFHHLQPLAHTMKAHEKNEISVNSDNTKWETKHLVHWFGAKETPHLPVRMLYKRVERGDACSWSTVQFPSEGQLLFPVGRK